MTGKDESRQCTLKGTTEGARPEGQQDWKKEGEARLDWRRRRLQAPTWLVLAATAQLGMGHVLHLLLQGWQVKGNQVRVSSYRDRCKT